MNKRIGLIVLLAFCLRAGFVFVVVPATGLIPFENIDMDGYSILAKDIREGKYFFSESEQSVNRMPLYPALLAVLTALTPNPPYFYYTAQCWHIVMDCCTVWCVYLFCRRYFSERAAWMAALLYALYPLAWYRAFLMNTELIQTALQAMTLLLTSKFLDRPSTRMAFLIACLSILILCINPAFVLLPGFLALGLFVRMPLARAAVLATWIVVPISIFTLSWGARNYAVTGTYFLFDTRGGKEFWIGNNQRSDGRWEGELRVIWETEIDQHFKRMSALGIPHEKMNGYFYRQGMKEISADPLGAMLLFGKKWIRFWYVPASERMLSLTVPLQSGYLALGMLGLWTALRRNRTWGWLLPLGFILYFCGIYTLSYACIRFSQVVMPWVCALGGAGAVWILNQCGWENHESELAF